MKKTLFLLLLSGAVRLSAQDITANLTWSAFNTPDQKPYVETHLSVIGKSIVYTKQAGGFQGQAEIMMTFTQNDTIKGVKKYKLSSPLIADTSKAENFIDVQRFPLPPGNYTLQLTISDPGKKEPKIMTNRVPVNVDFPSDSVHISSIQLLESYKQTTTVGPLTRSGYDLVPYVSTFYPANMNTLSFYAEIYNVQKKVAADDKMVVFAYIESAETGARINSLTRFFKQSPQKVNVVLSELPIETLPNGRYRLVMEVRNSVNRLLAQNAITFDRLNPGTQHKLEDLAAVNVDNTFASKITNADTLIDFIRSLRPISSESEKMYAENRIKTDDIKVMQQYFYNYWMNRNERNPEGAWLVYNNAVQKVNRTFGTQTLRGYDTDRGRVYLQYGAPDQRTVMNSEPSSYPYEIWQYYTIRPDPRRAVNTTQTNKRFVFYNPDLVTNNYRLIHSDARGEIRDDRWELKLVKRDTQSRDFDDTKPNGHFGNQSEDLFNNPH